MRTVCFDKDIPRFVLTSALKPLWPGAIYSRAAPARLAEFPDPPLPGPLWVRVKNYQCGVCASDLSLLSLAVDPRISLAALPGLDRIYIGHELVGEISEVGGGVTHVRPGDRVVMDVEAADCAAQEIDPPCPQCARGNRALCENLSAGAAANGVGAGWSDSYTAQETAVYRVPPEITDDQATLIEPLSVGLRAALRRTPKPGQHALVLGTGTIGLATLQAVRAVAPDCHITVAARHPQQIALAHRLGADEVVNGAAREDDIYAAAARITGARLHRGMFGNRMLLGGFDVIYDCVGSARTVHDSLRCTRAGGGVVIVGVQLRPLALDLTPVWYQEVDLLGTMAHGRDTWQGVACHDYDLVVEFLRSGKFSADGFITHRFPLARWPEAVRTASDKRSGSIKVVIDHRQ